MSWQIVYNKGQVTGSEANEKLRFKSDSKESEITCSNLPYDNVLSLGL